MQNRPKKIIIHHSADDLKADQFEKINSYHQSLGFPISSLGFYVGYQYLINHNGALRKCRTDTEQGAHTKGLNYESIGICLEGNFDVENPTSAQKKALAGLLITLCSVYKLDVTDFYLHRDFRQTACPGLNIDINWVRYLYLDYKANQIKDLIPLSCET